MVGGQLNLDRTVRALGDRGVQLGFLEHRCLR
jgi:hypothetical protein